MSSSSLLISVHFCTLFSIYGGVYWVIFSRATQNGHPLVNCWSIKTCTSLYRFRTGSEHRPSHHSLLPSVTLSFFTFPAFLSQSGFLICLGRMACSQILLSETDWTWCCLHGSVRLTRITHTAARQVLVQFHLSNSRWSFHENSWFSFPPWWVFPTLFILLSPLPDIYLHWRLCSQFGSSASCAIFESPYLLCSFLAFCSLFLFLFCKRFIYLL